MFRFPSETQAPEATQGDSDAELTKAVDFATLISMSSLSAPDVQDDRLTGRKEIATRLAEQAEAFGLAAPHDSSTTAADNHDPVFECLVADRLELRGHTFEAELRYRRLQDHPAVANRLALMLDAKGFHRESWQWYVRAARSNDINSLFRLATICWSRGNHDWAMRLAKHAVAQLVSDAYNDLGASIDHLVRQRAVFKFGHHMPARLALDLTRSSDADYALGSVLLILAGRPDLARMAYCSALARGHSLAAVSLLDLIRRPMIKQLGSWRLSNLLRDGLNHRNFQKYSFAEDSHDDFDRSLLLLKNGVQDETFERLIEVISAPTDHPEDAMERVLLTTRLITSLRGYGQFGCTMKALRYIEVAADTVCGKVHHELATASVGDAATLINMIRDWSTLELSSCRQSKRQHSDSKDKTEGRGEAADSGTIGRLGREYFNFPPEHREVLILQLAGLYPDEVANALGCRQVDTDRVFADAVTRLQEAQQGEQVPTGKLLGAEVDSCFTADVLELITSQSTWSDAEADSRPSLPPNPAHENSWWPCGKRENWRPC